MLSIEVGDAVVCQYQLGDTGQVIVRQSSIGDPIPLNFQRVDFAVLY